ncbi:MAG: hypothetical protein U0414_38405 [Polyangiaceae bacterium]
MRTTAGFLLLSVLTLSAASCTITFDDDNDNDGTSSSTAATTTTTGAGSSSSGMDSLIPVNNDPDKHGFPDDVYAILQANCTSCHSSPTKNNAPVPFEYYEDTQAEYYTAGVRWWSQIREHAIDNKPPSEPFLLPPLPQAQKDVLSAWIATCGPDDTVPGLCAKGTGTLANPNP